MSWSFKILFDQRLRNFQSKISTNDWGDQWGFESGPERGGPAILSEPDMNRQDYTKTEHKKSTFWCAYFSKIRHFSSESFL